MSILSVTMFIHLLMLFGITYIFIFSERHIYCLQTLRADLANRE